MDKTQRSKGRWAFGAAIWVATAVWSVLKFPGDIAAVAASWLSLHVWVSMELFHSLVGLGLFLLGAWFLSPMLATRLSAWHENQRKKKADAANKSRYLNDVQVYLDTVVGRSSEAMRVLRQLLDGPKQLSPQMAGQLLGWEIVLLVGPPKTLSAAGANLYRLNPLVKPLVSKMVGQPMQQVDL